MDTRNAVQRTVAILIIVAGACSNTVFARTIYTYGGDFDLPISDKSWMPDAVIDVGDHYTIHDLDVGITVTHTRVFDLQIFLQNPDGTKRICLNMYNFDEYFEGANYTNTIFDDEAEIPIEQAEPPFTGRFRPIWPYELSAFDDQDAYGTWHLQIYDSWQWDTGTLNSFEIIVTTPEPATAILLLLGTGLMTLFKPNRRS